MAAWTSQRTGRWNDDAANVTSPWNGGGNPAAGVPANTDTVVISLTHDVEFDADQSGFAAGITLTITGTLHASTTAGAYVLKLQANMTGAGTLRAGTSGVPYPTNCTFTINRNGFEITGTNMTLDLNCSEPTTKYVKLTGVEAVGQTVWSIDTDVTGETAYWADGALVRICDVNFGNDNAEHTIAAGGVAAGTITVTVGLAAQKETGAYIVLISRNVKITHTAATGNAINGGTGGTIAAEIRNAANLIRTGATIAGTLSNLAPVCTGCTFSGMIAGSTNGINAGNANILSSTGLIAGCGSGINAGSGFLIFGTIAGCSNGLANSAAFTIYGDIKYCTIGINGGGGHSVTNSTLLNTTDVQNIAKTVLYNVLMSGTTEFSGYNGTSVNITNFVESINHDQTANAYKAWTRGGIVTSNVVTVFGTRPRSYQHACESASFYVFRNYSVTVDTGGGLVVQCYIQKDAAMAYLPRLWILEPGEEPFISGTPTAEAIMTNSINTWETLVLVYANTGASPITLTVRTLAKDAGPSNVYFDPIITVLAPATYDVYNTLLGYVDTIESRLPAALTADGNIKADVLAISGDGPAADNAESFFDGNGYAGTGNTIPTVTTVTNRVTANTDQIEGIDATNQIRDAILNDATRFAGGNIDAAISSRLATVGYTAPPTTAAITAAIFAGLMEGRTFEEIIKDIWAQTVGDFLADDAADPTTITYDGPNGAVQITHTLTDVTRTVS